MKSIFYGALIACSAMFLTGCDEFSDTQSSRWLSPTEKAVYKTWYKTNTGSADTAIMNIARDRMKRNEPPKPDMFFCDAVVPMRIVEEEMKAMGNKQTLSTIYKNVTGKDACFVLGAENPKEKNVIDEVVNQLPSPFRADVDTLKALVQASKDCNIAKVKSIMNINGLTNISQDDATDIIRECEVYKLQAELNK